MTALSTTRNLRRRLALSAGLCFFLLILLLAGGANAEPIMDSYGRIIGFTEPEEETVPEPEPEPEPTSAADEEESQGTDALIDDIKRRLADKDKRIQSLREQAEAVSGDLDAARGRERTLAGQVAYLNRQIRALELQTDIAESQIEAIGLRVEEIELEIEQQEEEIATAQLRLSEVLRTMQSTEDQIGAVGLVFAARPFSEVFDALRAAELLDASLGSSLENIRQAKAELEAARETSLKEQEEAEALRDELRVRKTLLAAEEESRDALLRETRQQEAAYQEILSEVQEAQQEIEQEIRQLESQLRRTIDPSALPGAGVLSWPLDHVRITQGYGDTSTTGFINDTYNFHNGVDFGALNRGVPGDPVRAASGGIVVGVGSTGRYAYGRWVAVDHLNGLVTLYAHLSLQQVSVGQQVERGQTIGRMGSTGFSTAAHLHFTVYASETFRIESRWYGPLPIGASFDPMQFL